MTPDELNSLPTHAKLERNLERYPLFSLDRKNTKDALQLVFEDGRTWTVSTSSPNGLPGPIGNDIWVALGYCWNKFRVPPADRTIRTSVAELAGALGAARGGGQWKTIRRTLLELMEMKITQQGVFRTPAGAVARESHFRLVERVEFERDRGRTNGEIRVQVVLSQEIADSMNAGVFRLLDMATYRTLGDVGKRLYRYLDQRRYRGDRSPLPTVTLPLAELRERFPLTPEAPSQITRLLARAHEELVAAGILTDVHYHHTGRGLAHWTVTYTFAAPQRPQEPRSVPGTTSDLPHLVTAILEVLEDTQNTAWYTRIAKSLPEERLRSILGEARVQRHAGDWSLTRIRLDFSATCIAAAREYGLDLAHTPHE